MGFLKKQFLDIIQWLDDSTDTLVYMYPMEDQEIQQGGQLVVRPGQMAVFVDKGQIADVFGPGTYKLETGNLPILGDLKGWAFGFKSPFKSDVFFVNTKEMLNNKWGTQSPIWIKDPEFGQVQIRGFGTYTFNIVDPAKFVGQVSSTNKRYTKDTLSEQLRAFILTHFADAIGSLHLSIAEISSRYNELSQQMIVDSKAEFEDLGVSLNKFTIGNISLPEDIEAKLKELTGMKMTGSIEDEKLRRILALRQLDVMEKSAENDGLNAMIQGGMGLGMGVHMGGAFANGLNPSLHQMNTANNGAHTPAVGGNQNMAAQVVAGGIVGDAGIGGGVGVGIEVGARACSNCHTSLPDNAKFCNQCGTKQEEKPKLKFCMECGAKLSPESKFCNECGTKL